MSRADFTARFSGIYENSPWVAELTYVMGMPLDFNNPAELAGRMALVVESCGSEQQLQLLRAHPELAGRLAIAGALTPDSQSEQASARLDQCSLEEFARFTALNARYTKRFGFPFIVAVRGLDRAAILAAFEDRIDNDRDVEFETALKQVNRIAALRLTAMLDAAG